MGWSLWGRQTLDSPGIKAHTPRLAKASDINVHDRGPWGRGPLIV